MSISALGDPSCRQTVYAASLGGGGTAGLPISCASGDLLLQPNRGTVITSSSSSALAVGPAAAVNPTLNVNASGAGCVTGLHVAGGGAGTTTAVSVISQPADNVGLTLDALGTGAITIGGVSTGGLNLATGGGNVSIGTAAATVTLNDARLEGCRHLYGADAAGLLVEAQNGPIQLTSLAGQCAIDAVYTATAPGAFVVADTGFGVGSVAAISGATTVDGRYSGCLVPYSATSAYTITLPAVTNGLRYRFVCRQGGFAVTITAPVTSMYGTILVDDTPLQVTNHQNIVMGAGCLVGDWVECASDGTFWYVSGATAVAGAITSPS